MSRIADRFGRAASTYDKVSVLQREVAAELAELVGVRPGWRVAEFGCGTGHLTRSGATAGPALWLATDIAPAMIAKARCLPSPGAVFAVMDARRPALGPGFDLVCSSLLLQWLEEPAEVVACWRALARPGGVLAVSTLIEGAYAEWRAALAEAGAAPPGPRFAALDEARAWFGDDARIEIRRRVVRHASALEFLRAAKAGGFDAALGRPLDAGSMRRAMRALEAGGRSVTYDVLYAVETVG